MSTVRSRSLLIVASREPYSAEILPRDPLVAVVRRAASEAAHEVNDGLVGPQLRLDRLELSRTIADDDHLTRRDHVGHRSAHERPDMRDLLFNVVLVCADDT